MITRVVSKDGVYPMGQPWDKVQCSAIIWRNGIPRQYCVTHASWGRLNLANIPSCEYGTDRHVVLIAEML